MQLISSYSFFKKCIDPFPLYPNWLKIDEDINRMTDKLVPVSHVSLN